MKKDVTACKTEFTTDRGQLYQKDETIPATVHLTTKQIQFQENNNNNVSIIFYHGAGIVYDIDTLNSSCLEFDSTGTAHVDTFKAGTLFQECKQNEFKLLPG